MIKQRKDYIAYRKKQFVIKIIISTLSIIILLAVGSALTHERANLFTILAGLTVIPLAQNLTRYLSFSRYKDPKRIYCEKLENLTGNLAIYHSAIIPCESHTLYAEHIVLTADNMYILCSKEKDIKANQTHLISRMKTKGIAVKNIHMVQVDSEQSYQTLCKKLQKEAANDNSLDEKSKIIEGILM